METGPGSETLRPIPNNRRRQLTQKPDNSEGRDSLEHYADVIPKFNVSEPYVECHYGNPTGRGQLSD